MFCSNCFSSFAGSTSLVLSSFTRCCNCSCSCCSSNNIEESLMYTNTNSLLVLGARNVRVLAPVSPHISQNNTNANTNTNTNTN